MLSNELEYCLNDAFHRAREARHEYLTVEHLLLGILESPDVRQILSVCGVDLVQLKQELQDHVDQATPRLGQSDEREVQPTIGFQRVLQRAVFHVQSSGKKVVGVVNVLVAAFSEKDSEAVYLLKRHHVTRADVVKHIGHGQEKSSGQSEAAITGRSLKRYHYVLSLRLQHPSMHLSEATDRLGLAPTRAWKVGTPHTDDKGALLPGVHAESYWCAPLLNGEQIFSAKVPLEESLADVVGLLTPHRQFLISLRNSGGRCECFVLVSSPHFDVDLSAALMRGLAELGLDLGIDNSP